MSAVGRFLLGLLLGFILGAAGVGYLVQSGAGDLIVRRTEAVQDLQRRLGEVEQERDQLGRRLEEVSTRAGRMESAFNELEHRFRELEQQAPGGPSRPAE
jgi:hypothetical protein